MFKLINGIYYSEHDLDLDHEQIMQEVIDSRTKPKESSHFSRPHQHEVDPHHTFYEDTNLYDKTYLKMKEAVDGVINSIFTEEMMEAEEIWGHIIPPNEQTMVHNHGNMFRDTLGLSWVYYPHAPIGSGDLCFLVNVNGNNHFHSTTQQKGKLFLFSSEIMHFTPRNASNIDRISISGNHTGTELLKEMLADDYDFKNPYWRYSGRV